MNNLERALADVGNEYMPHRARLNEWSTKVDLVGNGHHMRQDLAVRAQILVYLSWPNKQKKKNLVLRIPSKMRFGAPEHNNTSACYLLFLSF